MDIQSIVEIVLKKIEEKDQSEFVLDVVHDEEKRVTVDNPNTIETIARAQSITPARIGIGRTGTRMKTKNYLDFRIDHAAAQDAVFQSVSEGFLKEMKLPILHSKAETMEEYLMTLETGRRLREDSKAWLEKNGQKNKHVQIVVSDGLSSTGIEANLPDLLPALIQGLKGKQISVGDPIFIKRSRVWIQDEVAKIVNCDVVISLIGERPGLATSKSISAYMIYRPNEHTVEADRTVISNIHQGGIPPVEAGAFLSEVISKILKHKRSGVKLTQVSV